ncbi:cadherin repeat domain-containing protein, partial [Sulfuricurvum sp.]|uniref:cadherin repeat domain-containing protein n=1 Tax=Sulfuricurvum sp. TaxID=2025608 RepID=UPI003C402008
MKSHVTAQSVQVKEVLEIVGDKGTVQNLKTGEANLIKVKAGEKYRIVKKLGGKEEIVDDVVAIKSDETLQLQYADGTHVIFEGFYQENSSSVELAANEGGIHTITSMGDMGSTDGNTFVYAHGNHDRLMGMTQGNEQLQVAVAKQTGVSNLPHYAAAATGAVTDAAGGGAGGVGTAGGAGGFMGLSNGALLGLGALTVGGVAVAIGSGGGEDSTPDTTAPVITSGTTATAIDENSGAAQVVYTATATDTSAITYTLKAATGDVALFTINPTTGAVTLTADPNFEAKSSYSFTVVATDASNNASEQAVTLAINNVNEAPVITSAATATAIDENSGAGQVVYTAIATDEDTADTITYSLGGTDAGLFSINGTTGAVTLTADPNFETKSSYSFNVIATDNGTGALSDTQAVTLA